MKFKKLFKEPLFMFLLAIFATIVNIIIGYHFPKDIMHPKQYAVLPQLASFNYAPLLPNVIFLLIYFGGYGLFISAMNYLTEDKFYFKKTMKIAFIIGFLFLLLMTFNESEFNIIATILATAALIKDKVDN